MKKIIALILFILLLSGTAFAGGTIQWPTACFFDSNGDPLSGGKLYSYSAGTTTAKSLYSDRAATTLHTNPEILDANGCTEVYGLGTYKLVLKDSSDSTTYFTDDNVEVFSGATTAYYPNYSATDQGLTGNSDTIKYAIDTCSTNKCTIVLQHNSGGADTDYILGTSDTAGSNVFFEIEPGAQIQPAAGISLTVHSRDNIDAPPNQQIIDPTNNATSPVAFITEGEIPVGWFGGNTSAVINTAIACTPLGGTTLIHAGTFTISETVTASKRSVHLKGADSYSGGISKLGPAYHGTIFNSTIADGSNVIDAINNVDDVLTVNDSVYATTKIENISILGNGSEGKGVNLGTTRTDAGTTDIGGLVLSYIKNVSVEDVGGVGVYIDHYVWEMVDLINVDVIQAGSHGFHLIGRKETAATYVRLINLRSNYSAGWGFYLEPMIGALFENVKSEHDVTGGIYLKDGASGTGSNANAFVNCATENQLGNIGTPAALGLKIESSSQNVFYSGNFGATDNPAVTLVGSTGNTFYSPILNTMNTAGAYLSGVNSTLVSLDSTSYQNYFYDTYAINSTFDNVVADANVSQGPNVFTFKRLYPGIRGTKIYASWTSQIAPNVVMNFSDNPNYPGVMFTEPNSAKFAVSPLGINFPTITTTESLYVLSIDAGSVKISPGQVLTGAVSGATGTVRKVVRQSGSWAADNFDGYVILSGAAGTPFTNNEVVSDPLGGAAVADGTGTAKANALDVSSIYKGVVDAGANPTTISFFIGGYAGQTVKLMNRSEDTELVLDHSAYFIMKGGGDFTASKYDAFEFMCRIVGENEEWWMIGLYEY